MTVTHETKESQLGKSEQPSKQEKQEEWVSYVSIRHNFSQDEEEAINELINSFYFGAYTCRSMQFYFDRDDVSLFGVSGLARCFANCQLELVRKLQDYQVLRGGRVRLMKTKKPEKDEWGMPIEALQYLINLFKIQVKNCITLYDICERDNDESLKESLERVFMAHLFVAIRKLGVMLTNSERAGPGLGEYQVNKHINLYLEKFLTESKIKIDKNAELDALKSLPKNANLELDLSSIMKKLNI
jgi:ferritin heavy chain